ncbi:MAG: hypothetical protein QM813_05165 [Verrucomicrobiota bacterium]
MKLKSNLALAAKPAQSWAQSAQSATPLLPLPLAKTVVGGVVRQNSPFALLSDRAQKRVRIPPPNIGLRPVFRGNKSYLRALRAAEMAAWNASPQFPTF